MTDELTIPICYNKNNNDSLFQDFKDHAEVDEIQNYIPIYNRFFSLNENNNDKINLEVITKIQQIKKKEDNHYICQLNRNDQLVEKKSFFKFSPLLDPLKYMTGKYDVSDNSLLELPKYNGAPQSCHHKTIDENNSAYIDGFFTYLTSQLLNNYNFIHGVDFYGFFLAKKKNFKMDIIDDVEYLYDNNFFIKNQNSLFRLEQEDHDMVFSTVGSRCIREKIKCKTLDHNDLEIVVLDVPGTVADPSANEIADSIATEIADPSANEIVNDMGITSLKRNRGGSDCSSRSSSDCSSRSSHTDDGNNGDDERCASDCSDSDDIDGSSCSGSDSGSGSDSDSDSDSGSEFSDDASIFTYINQFPVSVICLECCTNTLDSLIMGNKLGVDEWASILMQIIMMLCTFQEVFSLTHNDLHTNNIMYVETEKQYLYYCYQQRYYKVPTFGRIYKIIDFGRAIYKYKERTFCSDSFHSDGDAATQYNCEPYYNKSKPHIAPNPSFDLTRLGCSIFDYLVDDLKEIREPQLSSQDTIKKLIVEWCTDDNGKNILYKSNNEERYPEFKLYKMIARTVHNHTPKKQLERELFKGYLVSKKKIAKRQKIINIDKMPRF
jgi:hypothetical protein